MRARYAYDFAPDVVYMYNASGASIPEGTALSRDITTVTAVPDTACEDGSITKNVFSITPCLAADNGYIGNFIGVAHEAIADGGFGAVCVSGPCKALVNISDTHTVGMPMNPGTTSGAFIASTTPHTYVAATVMTAYTSSATAATAAVLLDVFVEGLGPVGGGGHHYITA